MAKRERRAFTEEFKNQIMGEIQGGRKLIEVAAEHKIQPSQISQWKRKMGMAKSSGSKANSATPGVSQPKAVTSSSKGQSESKKMASSTGVGNGRFSNSSIDELERMIGQLTVENARLRRELGR